MLTMSRILSVSFLVFAMMIQSSSALKNSKKTKFDAKEVAQQIIDSHHDMKAALQKDYDHHRHGSNNNNNNENRNLQFDFDGNLCAIYGEILTGIGISGFWTNFRRLCPLALRSDENSCELDQVDERVSLVCNTLFSVADGLLGAYTGEDFVCASLCETYYTVTCQGCD
eukprot:CAMPEP_0118702440 /NCGR_PEP_ID=MMETSP0800-20121206/17896_1 /TAXON_ID=210618 ORGANISM="Striatella unipunctata, Strain CCMP2910" /NCGR_SAMPLE_ID=MMETSP0800 /ASSEMBLY_ACC=CAM_ASM_000638 /LENGTH=168 /DNA_ID=CAMNT_0006603649 /DNA_START=190 /DNA_END=696 /DNA_ORIENTATION=-